MIKLEKLTEPQRLKDNASKWTASLLKKQNSGAKIEDQDLKHYRHPDVKAVLVKETHGKCAYCESRLKHIHHGDVEHIYPKSLDYSLAFEWSNLTLACEVCNQLKSDRDPKAEHIIDPYSVDPEAHFIFAGALISTRGSKEGAATRALLKLYRADLTEMRSERLAKVMMIYEQILDTTLPLRARRAIYDDLLELEAADNAQYAAMVRCLVKMMATQLPQDLADALASEQ
jgi:uncharacterized protein (TIGR02646 family)